MTYLTAQHTPLNGRPLAPVVLQRAPSHNAVIPAVPPLMDEVLRSPGRPLDAQTRALIEPRFAQDFSEVRVHADSKAAESARAVQALAYTVGSDMVFAEGAYQPTTPAGQRLLAHELAHVVQQQGAPAAVQPSSLVVGDPASPAEREADQAAAAFQRPGAALPSLSPLASYPSSAPAIQRQPKPGPTSPACKPNEMSILASYLKPPVSKCVGVGPSGAIVAEYEAHTRQEPKAANKKDKVEGEKDALALKFNLPILIFPPPVLSSASPELFVFFHGHRADLGERTASRGGKSAQGSEPIVKEAHLAEALAGTGRIGIAPQAPITWRWAGEFDDKGKPIIVDGKEKGSWVPNWNWEQALQSVHFDGLINIAMQKLNDGLKPEITLKPGPIHVAGHSGGGVGIEQSTDRVKGAAQYGDQVQDLTLQDAGYGNNTGWEHTLDWFVYGTPPKTMRVLVSHSAGGDPHTPGETRSILRRPFNKKDMDSALKKDKKDDILEVVEAEIEKPAASGSSALALILKAFFDMLTGGSPAPGSIKVPLADQYPRVGGFITESMIVVRYKKDIPDPKDAKKILHKTGDIQGTMVVFFARGGRHYSNLFSSIRDAATAGTGSTTRFLMEVKKGDSYRVIPGNREDKVATYKDLNHTEKDKPAKMIPVDTVVTVLDVQKGSNTFNKASIEVHNAQIKVDGDLVWIPLTNLAPTLPPAPAAPTPAKIPQQKRNASSSLSDEQRAERAQQVAGCGFSGLAARLPFLEQIQDAFGPHHDLSAVHAHLDEQSAAASRSMGAEAYTVGDSVAFAVPPDLHTAAHEAAHVVQQRRGVSLPGGASRTGDPYEQHADVVAGAVVAGRSAAPLLDGLAPGASHQVLQRKDLPLPPGAIPASDLDPLDTPEETEFRDRVYNAEQQYAIAKKEFTAGIPDSELDVVEQGHKLRKSAVPDAQALLRQARADLATRQAAGDQPALKVKKIGIQSAYRGLARERIAWQKAYGTNYQKTQKERTALKGGEFGPGAFDLLVTLMINRKAIPGFSNHSKGLAIDFTTTEDGLGTLGPNGSDKEAWRKSWFWKWLNKNGASHHFSPYKKEEWHWDHS